MIAYIIILIFTSGRGVPHFRDARFPACVKNIAKTLIHITYISTIIVVFFFSLGKIIYLLIIFCAKQIY